MGALFIRDERGIFSRRNLFSLLFAIRTPFQKVGCGGSRYGVIHTLREKLHGRQPSTLPGRLLCSAKSRDIIAARFLLLVTVVGTDNGVSSGQQVEPHGRTHNMIQQQQQQREKSWREQIWLSRQQEINDSATSRGGGGAGLVKLVELRKNE